MDGLPLVLDLAWFAEARGIKAETLEHFGVSIGQYDQEPAVVIPYSGSTFKYRWNLDARIPSDRQFRFTKGHKPWLFNTQDTKKDWVFLVEGETDAMRLWQELGPERRDHMGVVAIPGLDTWRDTMADEFSSCKRVYVILDNDEDYTVRAKSDALWTKIRKQLGAKARRINLPSDVKDLCEFFEGYDVETLAEMVKALKNPPTHYKPLDLSKPMPPYDWLLDGLICKGDIVLLQAEPNVGKSFLTSGLAVGVAEGWQSFLGRRLYKHGRVLIVDEENPLDVVLHRLPMLGLSSAGQSNVRYLWEQGVRLDRNPDKLLDEALAWEPELIVLDSLTRFHSQDENSAGSMASLFNDGVKPLARETGATVIILHHTNKTQGATSMNRTRGSSDLNGFPDTCMDIFPVGAGETNNLVVYKTRRGKRGELVTFKIEDTPEGGVAITHVIEQEAPF